MIQKNDRYVKTHECFRLEGNIAIVGITDYAIDQLGDVTYVALPEVGRSLQREESFGEIESVKTVSELYAPVSGQVIAINDRLLEQPELINQDPYKEGWIIKIELSDPEEVKNCLNATDYTQYLEQLN